MQIDRIIFTADAKFALKGDEANPMLLEGYALVWNVLSTDRGGYKVRLLPGSATFTTPTMALFHHDFGSPLGNTENNTLRIFPDEYGVKVEIDLPDTQSGRDTAYLVGKKYVRGMSFAMASPPKGRVVREEGTDIFVAENYLVDEVTITGIPSFTQATVGIKPPKPMPATYAARVEQAIQLERYRLDIFRPSGAEFPRTAV